jgi:uracil-DNA glycosylase
LQSPSKKAVETGYITRENPGGTAKNFISASDEAKIPREDTITWNTVPWYTANSDKEVEAALPWLDKLLYLLGGLRVVVLLGETAQKTTPFLYMHYPALCVIHAPHPSNQSLRRPGKRAYLHAAFRKAARKVRE